MNTEHDETDKLRLKIQALADNELPEDEIASVLETIQGSYEHRQAYGDLLQLKKRLAGLAPAVPGADWVAKSERSIIQKLFRGTGTVFFIGSYMALLGAGVIVLFRDSDLPSYVAVLVGIGVVGLLALLTNAITDRVRERKTDKYRGIIR